MMVRMSLVTWIMIMMMMMIMTNDDHLSLEPLLTWRPDPDRDTGPAAPELEHHQAVEQEDEQTRPWRDRGDEDTRDNKHLTCKPEYEGVHCEYCVVI